MNTPLQFRLLNDFQRDFPLSPRPYAALGRQLGLSEHHVIGKFARLRREGKISRIGAVLSPNCFGASTLAAMRIPREKLAETARRISRFPGVNHNYEREHRFNLWFVLTAPSQTDLQAGLQEIERAADYPALSLPLVEAFHIDLGFPLDGAADDNRPQRPPATPTLPPESRITMTADERRLATALQDGLPLAPRPFEQLARRIGTTEEEVIAHLKQWLDKGLARRFGVVVHHRALGYAANAMLVYDVPDDEATQVGKTLACEPGITLCYRRARPGPESEWPYNLFCMVHGRERGEVSSYAARLRERHKLLHLPHDILFSRRCFKQTGARYG